MFRDQSSLLENNFNSHSISNFITFDRRISVNLNASRLSSCFRIENDTSISDRRLAIHFRVFNFSFFFNQKNTNHRNSITTKSSASIINSVITRETSTKKNIHNEFIDFSNNSIFIIFLDSIIQTIIDVSMNTMMNRMQEMIQQNQSTITIDFFNSQSERESFELSNTKTIENTFRFVSKELKFFNFKY